MDKLLIKTNVLYERTRWGYLFPAILDLMSITLGGYIGAAIGIYMTSSYGEEMGYKRLFVTALSISCSIALYNWWRVVIRKYTKLLVKEQLVPVETSFIFRNGEMYWIFFQPDEEGAYKGWKRTVSFEHEYIYRCLYTCDNIKVDKYRHTLTIQHWEAPPDKIEIPDQEDWDALLSAIKEHNLLDTSYRGSTIPCPDTSTFLHP